MAKMRGGEKLLVSEYELYAKWRESYPFEAR